MTTGRARVRRAAWVLAAFAACARAGFADECWLDPPAGYARIGGAATLGPYPDYYAALGVNNEYFQGQGAIRCEAAPAGERRSGDFRYGAAKFHNNTGATVEFAVRRRPGGAFESVRVEPGRWYWWWQECPCRFHAQWDASRDAGYQRRTREVWWYGYGHRPTDGEARDWQFVERGGEIALVEGATPPPAPAQVSLVGRGQGLADAPWGEARSAAGTYQVDFLPRVAGAIPTLRGAFDLQWRRTVASAPVREEIWTLATTGMHGMGGQRQAVELTVRGGAGTAEYWTTRVPQHDAAGVVALRVHVQFSGANVGLSFTKAY